MLPHPFKTDTWVEGERSTGNNLCSEIAMPMSGNDVCVLGMKPSMIKYLALGNYIHQTQVHGRVWHLIGDTNLKLINSSYSGATPDQLMDSQEVLDLARELYEEHVETPTELYNTLGALRAIYLNEKAKLYGSFAFQQTLKEKGIMTASTEQLDIIGKMLNAEDGGQRRGELSILSAPNTGKSVGMDELTKLIEEASDRVEGSQGPQGDRGPAAPTPVLTSFDKPRAIKRKKSKPKSNHLPNMRNARTKRVLGATILNMLGKVQQDTADNYKRSLLKEIPLADFVELASGEKLPDYQANLLNAMQAKADPSAPIVERVNAGIVPAIQEHVEAIQPMLGRGLTASVLTFDDAPEQLSNEERLAIYEKNVDEALAKYISPELFPEELSEEKRTEIIALVKADVMERQSSLDRQSLVTTAMSILHPLDTEAA